MKSNRAEEYIDNNIYDAAECVDRDGCGWAVIKLSDAYRIVKLAEEDIADKAAQAFCALHCPQGCPMFGLECLGLITFKQKLMEE